MPGDPAATARWTITYRRCAAPFDGPASLASDAVKWSVVWVPPSSTVTSLDSSPRLRPVPRRRGSYRWIYLLLDKDSHEVVSEGTSAEPFDTSMFHLQGRTDLAGD